MFPGKYGQLIEACNKIPTRSCVASYEDAEGEDREGVHRALLRLALHAVAIGRSRISIQACGITKDKQPGSMALRAG